MTRRRVYIALLIVFLLLSCLSIIVLVIAQRRQEARTRTEFYVAILEDAPCIGSVCPGFHEGRAQALEYLERMAGVEAKLQGTYLIYLLFSRDENEIPGYGNIYFDTDPDGAPTKVDRIQIIVEGLTLKSVLDTLGEPDEYLFVAGCGMGTRVHGKLLYLSRGVEIVVEHEARRPNAQQLTGETLVSAAEYFEPQHLREHLSQSLEWYILDTVTYDLDPSVTEDDFVAQIRPWPGLDAQPTPSADFCPRSTRTPRP
jgi:hypothetical protein